MFQARTNQANLANLLAPIERPKALESVYQGALDFGCGTLSMENTTPRFKQSGVTGEWRPSEA